MDLYVEKQCVERLVSGELRQFLNLYDASFVDVYKYLKRRINDNAEIERILKFTFLEALALHQESPKDYSYSVWLFSLARKRVLSYLETNPSYRYDFSDIIKARDIEKSGKNVEKVFKMFDKMGLEESEIIKLKFLDQVSDSDIMIILNIDPETVGARIYRVLKRAHFLLFGEGDENQGVYFGELSGMLSSFFEFEKINSAEALRLTFKSQLSSKIDNADLVLDSDLVKEKINQDTVLKNRQNLLKNNMNKGSNDPAKVFVDAANSLNQEQKQKVYDAYKIKKQLEEDQAVRKEMKKEEFWDFVDSIKGILIFVPIFIFILVMTGIVLYKYWPAGGCDFVVAYNEELSDGEIADLKNKVADPVCKYYGDVVAMELDKVSDDKVSVNVEREEYSLKYIFDTRGTENWYVKKFEKALAKAE